MVDEVLDPGIAETFGLRARPGHRARPLRLAGLGHQVCSDYVRLLGWLARYRIHVPDRQLACAPASSSEGRRYLAAMAAAANFAWANRQAIADGVRRAIGNVLGEDAAERTEQVYDVAHNVAKVEKHRGVRMCPPQGATRAFPAGSDEIPAAYRSVGQPVFIPGSMGTASFVLAGEPAAMQRSFGTTCHGAGRRLPHGRPEADSRPRASPRARGARHHRSAPRRRRASRRRRRSPTRTSTGSCGSSSEPGSHGSPASSRSAS